MQVLTVCSYAVKDVNAIEKGNIAVTPFTPMEGFDIIEPIKKARSRWGLDRRVFMGISSTV